MKNNQDINAAKSITRTKVQDGKTAERQPVAAVKLSAEDVKDSQWAKK